MISNPEKSSKKYQKKPKYAQLSTVVQPHGEMKEKRAFEVTGETRNKYRKTQISQSLIMFVYLLLAALDLCCCAGLSLAVTIMGYSLAAMHALLTTSGFSCCGAQALVAVAHEPS